MKYEPDYTILNLIICISAEEPMAERKENNSMTYEEAKTFLAGCNQYAGTITLKPLERMLELLGNPQDQLEFIHIAGTNGKGSTLAYTSTALKAAGYRVGRYISPSIFSYRERIQVNEEYISREGLVRLTERIKKAGGQMLKEGSGHPTMFEAETALAFLWFVEQKCDIVVLEVGMGGLTDATNVIKNTIVAGLASISMDHIGVLGNTLGEIAVQKAGIIKPGCTVVGAAQQPEAKEAILAQAGRCGCKVHFVEPGKIVKKERGLLRQVFDYKERRNVEISLSGEYQFDNAALALEILDACRAKGFSIPEQAIRDGLRSAVWPGRFSVIADLKGKRLIYIMGVLADKEYEEVARQTAPLAAGIITVMTPDNPRALSAEALAGTVKKYNPHVRPAASIAEAVREARAMAGPEDAVLAFGSLSYLGELAWEVWKQTEK